MNFAFSQRFRFFLFGFGIVCFAMLAGAIYQSKKTAADLIAFPPPGRMISVNGENIHLYCIGSGFPTLILEAGLGENFLSWHPVQSNLAQRMRVCSYDRPGLGWSDLINDPIQVEDVAKNLHTLLNNAGISPPYVLVGHSRGGIYVRAFYRLFPEETRGIILVDSTHEQSPMHQYPHAAWDYWKQAVQIAIAEPLSRVGLVRLMGVADADRRPSPLPAEVLAAKTAVQNRTDTARAVVNEITVMRQGLNATTPPPTSLGDLPLLVLTAGDLVDQSLVEREAEKSGKNTETEKALARIQQTEQEDLARLSSNSRHIIIKNSGHFIMQDQAEKFVSAVSEFVNSIALKLEGERPTNHSTGPAQKAAQAGEFRRKVFMNFPFFIAASVLLLVGAYQVWITFRLAKAVEYSRVQKLSQFALIWLIPILGAAVVHFVLASSSQPEQPADRAFIRQGENHPDYPPFVGHDD